MERQSHGYYSEDAHAQKTTKDERADAPVFHQALVAVHGQPHIEYPANAARYQAEGAQWACEGDGCGNQEDEGQGPKADRPLQLHVDLKVDR